MMNPEVATTEQAEKTLARAGVKVWNTGRQYGADGQRMAAVVLPDGRVMFADFDRYIDGITTVKFDPDFDEVKRFVMDAYDYGNYNGACMTDVIDAFECAPESAYLFENALRAVAKSQTVPYLTPAERIENGADFSIGSYYTDGRPAQIGIKANAGRRTAIGVSVSGCGRVVSLPPRLNGGRLPDLDDVAAILRGDSVAAACDAFNNDELPPPPAVVYLDVQHVEAMPVLSDDVENARALAAEWSRNPGRQ